MASTIIVDMAADFFYLIGMLSPEQSRAARGWLDWSQEELARRANVSLSTVRDFEKGRRIPIKNNLDAIHRVLEAAGISLVHGEAGVATGIHVSLSSG